MKKAIFILFLVTITGCSNMTNHFGFTSKFNQNYEESRNLPPLRIPAHLQANKVKHYYNVEMTDNLISPGAAEQLIIPPNSGFLAK